MIDIAKKKIKTLPELGKTVSALKKAGKTIVQCHGVFDLVHPGHIRHFHSAKKEGDVLIVTVTADKHVKRGPGRPIFNEHLRAEGLAALSVTDFVTVLDYPTAVESIGVIGPHVYAKGPDYKNKKKDVTGKIYDEESAVKSKGGRVVYTEDFTFSSSNLINNYLEVYPPETLKYLKNIAAKYTIDTIQNYLQLVKKMKILVIGDAIVDQYHYCLPMGKSSKENIVVNKYLSEEFFAGGSLATANHTAEIAKQVNLWTLLGRKDSFEGFIRKRLSKNVRPQFFYRPDAGTTVKRRFVSDDANKKLFEICYMDDKFISGASEKEVLSGLRRELGRYDLVIVADFGHGLLTERMIDLICQKAKTLALNVQTNSANHGFNLVTKYSRADFICIDEQELRLAMHDKFSELEALVEKIAGRLGAQRTVVTRGAYGSLSFSKKEGMHRAPAFSYQIVDKVGAGDAFYAYTAPCFAAGMPQDMMSFVGNAVGSLAVQIICNRGPVKQVDLVKFITRLIKF